MSCFKYRDDFTRGEQGNVRIMTGCDRVSSNSPAVFTNRSNSGGGVVCATICEMMHTHSAMRNMAICVPELRHLEEVRGVEGRREGRKKRGKEKINIETVSSVLLYCFNQHHSRSCLSTQHQLRNRCKSETDKGAIINWKWRCDHFEQSSKKNTKKTTNVRDCAPLKTSSNVCRGRGCLVRERDGRTGMPNSCKDLN